MMLSLLYGMYVFLLSPKKLLTYSEAEKSIDATAFIQEINTTLGKTALNEFESHAMKQIKAEWTNNPFYEQKLGRDAAKESGKTAEILMSLNYTGYLEIGEKKMAIINGIEYGAGEPLYIKDGEEYMIKNIYPSKVVIQNGADKAVFEVLLQE